MLIWALVLYRWQMRRCVRIQYGRLCISEQWMEWVTYKVCQIRRSRRGSRALGHRARPPGCRSPRRDSETPQCHTRWLLGWHEERGKGWRKREKMQHEVIVANEVDSRQTGNVNLNVSERERVPAFFIWWKALPIIECCSVSPFFSVRTWGHNFFFSFFFLLRTIKIYQKKAGDTGAAQTLWFWQLPPSDKDALSFAPWQTITKQFGKFVLIFSCLRGAALSIDGGDWGSSVKAQSTKKSS